MNASCFRFDNFPKTDPHQNLLCDRIIKLATFYKYVIGGGGGGAIPPDTAPAVLVMLITGGVSAYESC